MNCAEIEKLIYTFHEAEVTLQQEVRKHLDTCENCRTLFNEMESVYGLMKKVNTAQLGLTHPTRLTDKVMREIAGLTKSEEKQKGKKFHLFDLSFNRLALAAVSCGILVLFFIEVLVPDFKSGKIRGPMTNIQGAIIKSEDFRKAFTRPKEKKSLFADCKNVLSKQVDPACVKEKIKNLNF